MYMSQSYVFPFSTCTTLLPTRRNYLSATSQIPFQQNLDYTVLYYLKLFEERVSCVIMLKMSFAI